MMICIDLPDATVLALASQASKEKSTIQDLIVSKLADLTSTLQDLDDERIEQKISELQSFAFSRFPPEGPLFTLQELFEQLFGESAWKALSPSTRKKLGRRFKLSCEEKLDPPGCHKIVFMDKTITNAALYGMSQVEAYPEE